MRFKSLTNDQTVPRYCYFNFYKPHKVDGKGFSSQMPTLKTVPSDQKSNRRTCAEECQMPFKHHLYKNLLRPTWKNTGSYSRGFTVLMIQFDSFLPVVVF